ncbi:hypothetical protein cypCar_00031968 [Cyprinus carpio]|nr:hypothetical protein cypCar_00031968 [Cyprinus carpio]
MFIYLFLSARSRPTITPEGPQLTVPLNSDFSLHCQSDSSVRWLREDRPTRILKEQRQGEVTVLKVNKAGPQHMGKYSCREEESGEKSSIYVYVKGKSVFCILPNAPPVITLGQSPRVLLIQGEELSLSCNTSNVNSDITIRWKAPQGVQPSVQQFSSILTKPSSYLRNTTLNLGSVTMQDAGSYNCEARNERGTSAKTVWVEIYEKGFINLTSVNNSTKRVRAGESLSLRVVMDAYPKPHAFSWSYSGVKLTNTTDHVITSHSHGNRYTNELKLVRLKVLESGFYTFSCSNGDATVHQTFEVHVISKPQIVSHEGPIDGQVRCVAEGYPTPQIKWYYCDQPHSRYVYCLSAVL